MSRKPAQEARALFATATAEIDRLPIPHLKALVPIMVQAEAELARDYTRWLRTIPDGEARFTAQQYRVALVQMRAALRRARGMSSALFGVLEGAKDDAGGLALGHLARQVEKFGALFPGSVRGLPFRPAAVLAKGDSLLIRRIRSSAERYGEYVAQDIQRQLAVGMVRDETFAQMTTRIQKLAGHVAAAAPEEALTAGQRMAAAVVARHRSRAEAIVRTEAIHAYNTVAEDAVREAVDDDPDYLKRWDATLDQRGCLACRALHNVLREVDKEFPGGVMRPPKHTRCRCAVTFWHRDWGAPPAIERDAPAAAGATKKETREVEKTPKAPAKIDHPAESLPEIPPVTPAPPAAAPSAPPAPAGDPVDFKKLDKSLERMSPADQASIRDAGNKVCAQMGVPISEVDRTSSGGKRYSVGGIPDGGGAVHWPDGSIAMTEQYHRDFQAFAKRRAAGFDYEAELARIERDLAGATGADRAALLAKQAELRREVNGASAFVHESLHGHSPPATKGAFVRGGLVVEEVTTELSARSAMQKVLGISGEHVPTLARPTLLPSGGLSPGPYNRLIRGCMDETTKVLSDLGVEVTEERVFDALTKASLEFKADHSQRYESSAQMGAAFANRILAQFPELTSGGRYVAREKLIKMFDKLAA